MWYASMGRLGHFRLSLGGGAHRAISKFKGREINEGRGGHINWYRRQCCSRLPLWRLTGNYVIRHYLPTSFSPQFSSYLIKVMLKSQDSRQPFLGPLVPILDFAGGEVLQSVRNCRW